MPIYEYKCPRCSLKFELMRQFGENGAANCPRCQDKAHRIFSAVPIVFKGPGFYITDNAVGGRRLENRRNGEKPAGIGKGAETSKDG
jgi:putative FmdB family regulatory protein